MKSRKIAECLFVILAALSSIAASSQELWLSAEGRYSLTKRLRIDVEAEHRSSDGFAATSRWSAGVGVGYKTLSWLKTDISYKFIDDRNGGETTRKGNFIPAYWQPRHRLQASLTGSFKVGKVELSLREAYQFTHRKSQYVAKFDSDGDPKDDEHITSKNRQLLRSRLEGEFHLKKKARFTPYASIELYNDVAYGFGFEKVRYTLGTDFRINKRNSLNIFYRFIDRHGEDNTNVVGLGYAFKL